jgi:hypothetical protein
MMLRYNNNSALVRLASEYEYLRSEHLQKVGLREKTKRKNGRKMAEMAWRKDLALGHHRAFRTKNGRNMAP